MPRDDRHNPTGAQSGENKIMSRGIVTYLMGFSKNRFEKGKLPGCVGC